MSLPYNDRLGIREVYEETLQDRGTAEVPGSFTFLFSLATLSR